MVPVSTAQVGCTVTLAVGAAGAPGTGSTVNDVIAEVQLVVVLVVTTA